MKDLSAGTKALPAAAGFFRAATFVIASLDGVAVRAQTASPTLKFEVASVRLPASDARSLGLRSSGIPGPNNPYPGRFSARLNVGSLILLAYDIPLYRLSEQSDAFGPPPIEVEARMPVDTTREQFNVMPQNLLADRLGLKVHWTTQNVDTYAMVVAKGGPKLRLATADSSKPSDDAYASPGRVGDDGFPIPPRGNGDWMGGAPGGKMALRGHNQTAEEMAHYIGMRTLDGPVTDTAGLAGLTGKYDYTVFWSTPATSAALGFAQAAEPEGPSIFDAVEEQLGLKIVKRKSPAQVLVVDHVEKKPVDN